MIIDRKTTDYNMSIRNSLNSILDYIFQYDFTVVLYTLMAFFKKKVNLFNWANTIWIMKIH